MIITTPLAISLTSSKGCNLRFIAHLVDVFHVVFQSSLLEKDFDPLPPSFLLPLLLRPSRFLGACDSVEPSSLQNVSRVCNFACLLSSLLGCLAFYTASLQISRTAGESVHAARLLSLLLVSSNQVSIPP